MIQNRLKQLREKMKENHVDAYIVCTNDFHGSEYVGDYFKTREYLSGFSGSAGTLVVTDDEAGLWTDGRYFIQAAKQLENTGITLMKMGNEGVETIEEYLNNKCKKDQVIGFDGRMVSAKFAKNLQDAVSDKGMKIAGDIDLVSDIWQNRPQMSKEPVWELGTDYAGKSRTEKLKMVREKMDEMKADYYVITSLDEIAWLLNLRGNDVAYNPVFLSYVIVEMAKVSLYIQKDAVSEEICSLLAEDGVQLEDYDSIYNDLQLLDNHKKVLLDVTKANFMIKESIANKEAILEKPSIITLLKAIKTKTEYDHCREAHVRDGVAVTKFMYWLKHAGGQEKITEMSAAKKLETIRKEQKDYIEDSFDPIMAYGEHGAICHYAATEESDLEVLNKGFFLCDTGAQYLDGTTDITRTFAMGELTEEEKRDYTLVLRGNLNLAAAHFLYGVTGVNLDYLARSPLWEYGLDYNHGTGHGVGYVLNVHESPNGFRWKIMPDMAMNAVLEEGMITSDEPGIYIEGKFGVRLENLILCKKAEKTEYGQFMEFETLTMVPFDLDAVDVRYMSEKEIELLNQYHKKVYDTISPYLSKEEVDWLKNATREISKN